MKKLIVGMILSMAWSGLAWGHAAVDGLPDAVAIMTYKQVLYLNPDDLATRNKLAMALFRENQLREAVQELDYVLKKDRRNFDALDGYGVVLIRTGKYKKALEYLNKALAVNPNDMMLRVHRYVVYQKLKAPDKAKEEWEKAHFLVKSRSDANRVKQELRLLYGR
jgi:tetratricopeptide (TPR) repeat protein